MRNHFLCSLLLCAVLSVQMQAADNDSPRWNTPGAGNPFIPGYFADPTIRKFTVNDANGKPRDVFFLYATTDGTGNGYGPAQVWASYDFRNWQNIVMNWPVTEVVWAPDVVQQPDGSFRYYYCRPCEVIVGESKSPIGPWRNILGTKPDAVFVPDRFVHNAITLDPQLFRDDDGQEYLYFCTWGIYKDFGCGVAKVNGKTLGEKKLILNTELKDIFEAPYVFKRNGIYYFTYSSGSCHDDTYRVQYATSKVGPMGPFEYKGCILKTNADQTVHGPGHHSILKEGDRYYIVYHRHNLPRSVHGFNRQVCIDEMKFDAEGNILPIEPTHTGLSLNSPLERDLSFGAKVTASSYYDEWFKPEYAVDDNNATLWKARGTNWGQGGRGGKPEWLQIDLGKKHTFTEIWTQFEYPTFFYQYKIETSLDDKQWTLFSDRTQNTTQGSPMIDYLPLTPSEGVGTGKTKKRNVKARYIRITITDTQKNGHIPAIWNVRVWKEAPELPYSEETARGNASYPGMHKKDVETEERMNAHRAAYLLNISDAARHEMSPFDVDHLTTPAGITFHANKSLRARIKDGRWALFFNGSQHLSSDQPLSRLYSYNAAYTISLWALQTEPDAVETVVSLSSSRADLATTELRLGTDPRTGLVNHNGSFESYGAPETVRSAVGQWHHWLLTFDGWMERVYRDGELVHEQNNFIMVRPEGRITIGGDADGANHFKGYISEVRILPRATTAEEAKENFERSKDASLPSLGDDDFDESDPDSRFTLSPTMKKVFSQDEARLSAQTADFNNDPLHNGATILKEVEGDFVLMAHLSDMEGLQTHSVKGYNEAGIFLREELATATDSVQASNAVANSKLSTLNSPLIHLGVFPLYNCGNMLTVLSPQGRPQFPNSKGYDFDPILQFERRGNQLFARTSRDGVKWTNMPGSPIEVSSKKLSLGIYQTTYTPTTSWAILKDIVIYQ
ncbi:family 43 glycosylhydrolase [Prevotella sp. E13-27]|nr:family 43 glycosylhydrolase [Prevotella sp. E13-27]MCK8621681.1 family 43 glycosylhydrolase [Prevotella sp. E13-27]